MKVVILAGGMGSRISEESALRPKPMVEIGGKPILWHIMHLYAAHGFSDFVVALGYKGEEIKKYFLQFHALNANLSLDLNTGKTVVHEGDHLDWRVDLVDTGVSTLTGGRLRRVREWVGGTTFMATYGDGLADVDLKALLKYHKAQGRLATVTAVRPPSRFGSLVMDDGKVTEFTEKPQTGEGWINGGFFVLEPEALKYASGDESIWEREPLERLAADGQLAAFQHPGFFQPMDTLRDRNHLEELWQSGHAPWKVW